MLFVIVGDGDGCWSLLLLGVVVVGWLVMLGCRCCFWLVLPVGCCWLLMFAFCFWFCLSFLCVVFLYVVHCLVVVWWFLVLVVVIGCCFQEKYENTAFFTFYRNLPALDHETPFLNLSF